MQTRCKAFTLVELIVVITILAILGTIGFVSLQGYSVNARDSVRIADTKTFLKALNIYQTKNAEVPLPDNMTTITGSGAAFSYQGTLSGSVITELGQGQVPLDPLLQTPYLYATNVARTKVQLLSFHEKNTSSLEFQNTPTYAETTHADMFPKVMGDDIGIVLQEDNTPLGSGSLDIENLSVSYKLIKSNDRMLEGTGSTLMSASPRKTCLTLLENQLATESGEYTIYPSGIPIVAYCDMETEGGGYTMYPIDSGIRTHKSTDPNSCQDLGMDIIVPRSREHFASILARYDASYFRVIPGVSKPYPSRQPSNIHYQHYSMNSDSVPDWQAVDGGRWWLRDSVYTEPNGDYMSDCWLKTRSISDVDDIKFNDAWGTVSSTCHDDYFTEKYICSPNDKP